MLNELKDLYIRDIEKLRTEISSYKNESDLAIVKGTILNSAGNLCLHLCGNLQTYLGAMLGGSGYIRNRDKEFSEKNYTKASLLAEIDKAKSAVELCFSKITEADVNKKFPETPHWEGFSILHVLIICETHLAYHLGQINYHRRLLVSD